MTDSSENCLTKRQESLGTKDKAEAHRLFHARNEAQEQPAINLQIARAMCEESGEQFIEGPSKYEFREYRHREEFIGSLSDADAADQLWRAIKGKDAFR